MLAGVAAKGYEGDRMTGYERFMTALRREEPDRVPQWELIVNEPTLSAWGASTLEEFVEQEDMDGITIFEDMHLRPATGGEGELTWRGQTVEQTGGEAVVDEWGVLWRFTGFGIPYPTAGPIGSEADLRRYEPPEPDEEHRLNSLRSAVERFKGQKAIVFLTHDGFEFVHNLRGGMQNLLIDYVEKPHFAHQIAEMVSEYKIRLMRYAIEQGADAIVSGDDYAHRNGPIMSPAHFREFVLPYLRRSVEAAHEMGTPYIKHTDGNIWLLLEDMVEVGIDAIDPLEPIAAMDIGEVKRKFGDRVAVVGNVDCAELLPHATSEEVEAAVKETIAKGAPGGGHILASSNSIHPAVRPENYRAMAEAGRRWGEYPLSETMVRKYREKSYIERWMEGGG